MFGFGNLPSLQQRMASAQAPQLTQSNPPDPSAPPTGFQGAPTSQAGQSAQAGSNLPYQSDLDTMQTGLPKLGADAGASGGEAATADGGSFLSTLFAMLGG